MGSQDSPTLAEAIKKHFGTPAPDIRDYFAAHAPLALLVAPDLPSMTKKAYEWADEMLKAREGNSG